MRSQVNRVASWNKLPTHVPVLPAVTARALPVDPAKGFWVKEVRPTVDVVTDGSTSRRCRAALIYARRDD